MKTVKLSDVLIIKYGKDHKNLDNGNIPVYGSGGLMRMVDNYLYDGESVLIPRKGSLNNVQFVSGKFWTVDTLFWTIINSNLIRPKYLYYILKQLNFLSMNVGSAVPSLTASILYPIEITIPSLEIQDKILLKILPIESKIYLNKQINDNLIELATDLFNSKVVNNATFEEKSLTEIADYKNGLAMQKFRPKDGEAVLPVLKIRELNQGSTDGTTELVTSTIDEAVKVFDGDVIFSWSGTLLVKLWTGGDAALNQHLFKVTSTKYPKWFYYLWTLHHLRRFQNVAKSKATTMGHIKRSDLSDSKVLVPDTEELSELNTIFEPIIEQIVNLGIQIKLLEKTRDQLLPKLLSGEIELN
ncbi:restriction endonuclease subunit S [Leuconostoc lactis]|uniref:restriction endonuclease subunit S n=1 Tax=Leuconostoc lactis TaxID=1246 RepID=UPI0024AE1410|nr:restriction endonuclease subunit S [Leuconostoc lactis]MDI6495743.1 restriction endonuclease subunit S [Leuconostoc lactis]